MGSVVLPTFISAYFDLTSSKSCVLFGINIRTMSLCLTQSHGDVTTKSFAYSLSWIKIDCFRRILTRVACDDLTVHMIVFGINQLYTQLIYSKHNHVNCQIVTCKWVHCVYTIKAVMRIDWNYVILYWLRIKPKRDYVVMFVTRDWRDQWTPYNMFLCKQTYINYVKVVCS